MMIDSSRYWEVFDHYRQHFGEERIKVIWFEEFISNTDQVFNTVCRFLGISETTTVKQNQRYRNSRAQVLQSLNRTHKGNELKIDSSWTPETLHWAISQLREDNTRLLQHFGKPLDYWGKLFVEQHQS